MADIRYKFIASGQAEVASAFRGIDQAALRSSATVSAAYARTGTSATRAAQTSTTARQRAEEHWAAAAQKASQKGIQAGEKAADKRWRDIERAGQKIQREFDAEARAAEKAAAAQERASQRVLSARLKAVGRLGKDALMAGAGAAVFGSAALIASAARESLAVGAIANRVSINARMPGQEAVNPGILKREFEETALKTPGIKAKDVAEAAQAYVDFTGDLQTARKNMDAFATTASATGADIKDVALAAASLGKQFDIKDTKSVQQTMALLTAQGKGGALTMADMASQLQRLAAAGAAFGLPRSGAGVTKLGGILQIARSASGSPEEAATALENVFSQLQAKSTKLGKAGVHVYGKGGKKNDLFDILADTISKVGGSNIEKKNAELFSIFGRRGIRAINPLVAEYQKAAEGKTGKEAQEAGRLAIIDKLNDAARATSDWTEVQKDAAQAQETMGAKLTKAWEMVQKEVGDAVVPELVKLAPVAVSLASKLGPLAAAFGILLEAANALADALGIKGKEKSKQEIFNESQEKLKSYEDEVAAKHGSSGVFGATAQENDKLKQLRKAAREAGESMWITPQQLRAEAPATENDNLLRLSMAAQGAAVGGAAGAVGGVPGTVVGAAVGGAVGAGSAEQGIQRADLHEQGMIETQSGALIGTGGGTREPDEAAKALKGFIDQLQQAIQAADRQAAAADRAAAALQKVQAPSETSI